MNKQLLLIVAAIAMAGAVAFTFPGLKVGAKIAHKAPRTMTPMAEFTKYYQHKRFDDGDVPLDYFFYQPTPPYPEGLKFPLVLILHGTPGNSYAGKFLISGNMPIDFPAFIAVPVMAPGQQWISTKKLKGRVIDTALLVRDLAKKYPVDEKRIYVLGCSEGGSGTFAIVRNNPGLFAAAAPMQGAWVSNDAKNLTKTPLWVFQGGIDPISPPERVTPTVAAIQKLGGSVMYTEFPMMSHNCPSPLLYSQTMWKWLFSQSKP